MSHAVTVVVRSPDPLTRAGACSLLRHEPDVRFVETPDGAGNGPPAVVVVVVARVDDGAETELRRSVRAATRGVVLVVDTLREPELMKVLEHGVRTILWRHDVTPAALAGAVRAAARGATVLPPDLLGNLVTQVGRTRRASIHGTPQAAAAGLVEREIDVVGLLAEGLETREIAEKLAYSERTIKNVLHGLTARLNLRNRAHAVAYALREGYI